MTDKEILQRAADIVERQPVDMSLSVAQWLRMLSDDIIVTVEVVDKPQGQV